MHENMKTSMWHTGRSERTWRLPACISICCLWGNKLQWWQWQWWWWWWRHCRIRW